MLHDREALLQWAAENAPKRGKKRKSGRISLVIPGLYLGNRRAASEEHTLQERGVRAVVNVGGGQNHFSGRLAYHKVGILDRHDAALRPHLPAACDFIHQHLLRGRPVFVHCMGGISRSPSVVVAYLIRHRGLSFAEAMALVKQQRPSANPNPGFRAELEAWAGSEGADG